jgi:hypothetical protein
MKPQSQRGVALVITLIMLSVVTVMAVVFLGISRRERASVGVIANQTDARLAAEAGLARAQAELLGRIAASDNLFDYDYFVSTNYISAAGFRPGLSSITNVSYVYANGQPIAGQDLLQNLTNLFLYPRAPVFVRTNRTPERHEFRFFLDLNRNRVFDTNGWGPVWWQGSIVNSNLLRGDPEWIGVLARPDWPHSGTNRFVSRYAYLVLPAGRSLDINFIHNRSKGLSLIAGSGDYNRNQGVAGYELNLAAFLRTLLPAPQLYGPGQYLFESDNMGANGGNAFRDARAIVNYRHLGGPRTMESVWGPVSRQLDLDPVDYYADDVLQYLGGGAVNVLRTNDNAGLPWPGNDNQRAFTTLSDLFATNKTWQSPATPHESLSARLAQAGSDLTTTTNRYAFYRLISQMGMDSLPVSSGRIHLNFTNGTWASPGLVNGQWTYGQRTLGAGRPVLVRGVQTNLVPWSSSRQTRQDFFMLTANAILKEVFDGQLPGSLDLERGIQIYPTNFYSGAVHRCLQLAANILDANTLTLPAPGRILAVGGRTNIAPTVFRPIFARDPTNQALLKIMGYEEVENATPLRASPWRDLTDTNQLSQVVSGDNILGVPWVFGARTGWPNFNEFALESTVIVTRRLQARRPNVNSQTISFRQNYEIAVSNLFGLESWNAYTQEFAAPISIFFTNRVTMGLIDSNRTEVVDGRPGLVAALNAPFNLLQTNLTLDTWPGRGFIVTSNSYNFVPRSGYLPGRSTDPLLSTNVFGVVFDNEPGFPVPNLHLEITNRILYATVVPIDGVDRVVDLVTLNPLVGGFDIQRFMAGETNLFSDGEGSSPGRFWITNRPVNSLMAMTAGITNQLFVSTNDSAARLDWSNWSEDPISGQQRERAIDEFRMFMGMPPLYDLRRTTTPALVLQVPFSPTRRLLQRMSWQANDPLVHYTFDDLYSSEFANPTNVVPVRPTGDLDGYTPGLPNLGLLNGRYSPWGGRPDRQLGSQKFAFNPAVQDPGVTQADDWELPGHSLPHVGWLGRIHRGTPWQTVYLKAGAETVANWLDYAGQTVWNQFSHPTNDWRLIDRFTTTLNENMTRGLLGVNQTNEAAWAAVFGGLRVRTNTVSSLNPADTASFSPLYVEPTSPQAPQLARLVEGINTNRLTRSGAAYQYLGEILSAPILTDQSPFLNLAGMSSGQARINDAVYEGLPQQILGLLKADDPYFVIYSYGQALRPADRSLVVQPGPYFNLATNYQIVGEVLSKAAVRLQREVNVSEDRSVTNVFYNAVVEDFTILPVD